MGAVIFWSVFVLLIVGLTIGARRRTTRNATLAHDPHPQAVKGTLPEHAYRDVEAGRAGTVDGSGGGGW
jgi:hypothetical protein